MRGLQNAKQYGCPDRTNRRNLAEPFPSPVFLALRQQLPPHLLTRRPQRSELLVVKLGTMARCIDLLCPVLALVRA
jgi:hypothetical protein